ncbi:hypothetical protein C9374_010667 [Naegleria lovaniensis]|uniref:Proteasome subunit beta n=1 Tax=Naegleria lovaniensis TaxID=51637 RepID=A0AA88GGT6_NAELO|nr:uncharacterized protein C9374_010627 [Naegleria lovaniensis]XP_044543822.1 uncharacterized protein C9374_010667 [Naegleria lovaniensis]KAG2374608.1 hypothetical protein C9374_010627 [Naegleria lovaniensis]KAG2374648.1 hypothetical protein C9374_010667 [Naegleria lovaniensis]
MSSATHNNSQVIGGFDFGNVARNIYLQNNLNVQPPKTLKTGTTICGVVFKDGVVLGADTRATNGPIVADKNCEKIHYIAPNIYCCGAGTAADTENTTALISSKLQLHRYATGKQSRVDTAMTMFKRMLWRYQGHISAALVLGGVDVNGPALYTIYPHGSTDRLPFVTMGSGSLAAMSVFESEYKDDMTEEEAKAIVHKAISAGIYNDLGSGSNVDLCVINKDGVANYIRGYDVPSGRKYRREYVIPRGTTAVLNEKVLQLKSKLIVEEESSTKDAMQITE